MAFGAIIADPEGNPFYIDGTLPLRLVNKVTKSVDGTTFVPVHKTDNVMRFIFCEISANGAGSDSAYVYYEKLFNTDDWGITAGYYSPNGPGLVTVYVFEYQYETLIPKWGVAFWDSAGRCVLTNETKVLRGVTPFGVEGQESAGYNINTTLNGRWAVLPVSTGIITGVINSGGTRPFMSTFFANAYYNGSTTKISSGGTGGYPGGGVSNITYTNAKNRIMAIDVSMY